MLFLKTWPRWRRRGFFTHRSCRQSSGRVACHAGLYMPVSLTKPPAHWGNGDGENYDDYGSAQVAHSWYPA